MKPYVLAHGAVTKDQRYPGNDPDDKRYKRRYLAEGDSWFSLGGVPYENLLMELDLPARAVIVNIAESGDEIVRMASPSRVKAFTRLVVRKATAYEWDAILLSGGGNDLIDRAGAILRSGSTVDACINQTELAKCMREVATAYRALAEIRDGANSVNAGVPMIAHTYDYPTPRNAPALFFGSKVRGPWLFDAFSEKQIDENLWVPVADRLMAALAETILGLATGPRRIAQFSVVETRNTLDRAELGSTKKSGDWRNEIHPWKGGYAKLAARLATAIPA
ncbi:MAG: hypothetical protein K2Y35_13315 [Burkholderiales bacterium]|nr:hypothetical protein [Burkholderiales bacterium]